jgi:mono/diheme cytochrome c family protein
MIRTIGLTTALLLGLAILGNLKGTRDIKERVNGENRSYASHNLNSSFQAGQLTGDQLYTKYCLTCHQHDGNGVRGTFPPLAGNAKVTGTPTEIIRIVLFGLQGPITVNGRDYNQPMPPQAYLSDKQIADVLNYIRNNFGNKAALIQPQAVAKERKAGKTKTN